MLKLVLFLGILFVGFIAYTGIDISKEYEAVSHIRDDALNIVDPLSKKVLTEAANSNFDEFVNSAVNKLKEAGGNQ